MKFEDVEVGLCVQDHFGNEYKVRKICLNLENGYGLIWNVLSM